MGRSYRSRISVAVPSASQVVHGRPDAGTMGRWDDTTASGGSHGMNFAHDGTIWDIYGIYNGYMTMYDQHWCDFDEQEWRMPSNFQTGTKWWSTRRILGLPRSFSLFYEAPGGLRSASDRYGSHRFGNHSEIEIINLLGMFTYPIFQVWDYPVEFAGWSYPNLGILKKHRWKRLSSCSIWGWDNIHIFC